VLVAGNEPVALLSMKRRLEASGWSVHATVSSADALDKALDRPGAPAVADGGQPYDIVIIDSAMPGMSGFEFCEAVRRSKSSEALPIIVLLEPGRIDEVERAFRVGANDYIVRPASGIELAARVKTHVDLSSSVRRELRQAASLAEFDKYRTLATLSAGVAHEINTPNNAVMRTVPMLKEIWSGIEPVVERLSRDEDGFSLGGFGYDDLRRDVPDMLNDLYMGAQDIKKIVDGLKDYARAPSANASLAVVDANEAIRYAARLLKHTIAVSTDRFSMTLSENLPMVMADRLKLTQVLVNVLENALQAISARSDGVSVVSEPVDDAGLGRFVAIRIADEGAGMEPEVLASVFAPFFTTKRERGGSGLGLSVALGLVQDMRGTIDIQSRPGAGTTVTIRIPVRLGAEG
jgi:signal transduction histidine kinase